MIYGSEVHFKVILGLKIQQERARKKLSLKELGEICGLSKSYLNEIEKGKKYPKPDKLMILAKALDVDFEYLVRPTLEGELEHIHKLLTSPLLNEVPLEYFGLGGSSIVEFITKAPDRVRALLRTILDIGQHYNITKERFFFAVLQSYQEMHLNYFDDIEDWANSRDFELVHQTLAMKLKEYGRDIYYHLPEEIDHQKLRSVTTIEGHVYMKRGLSENQMNFILLKELFYEQQQIKERPLSFPWIYFDSFEQLMNNMRASYAAGAMLIPKKELQASLIDFLFTPRAKSLDSFVGWVQNHPLGVETVIQRITNLLPTIFDIKEIFFLRVGLNSVGQPSITKQLHLLKQWNAYDVNKQEEYCSKWLSIKALSKQNNSYYQVSRYSDGAEYLIITIPKTSDSTTTITLGILLTTRNKKKIKIDWHHIPVVEVGHTCQRCTRLDCSERKSPPIILEKIKEKEILTNQILKFTQRKSPTNTGRASSKKS